MSVVPSSSFGSSVKIPDSLTSKRHNKSTPYVSNFKASEYKIHKHKQEGELVNLRIPNPFGKEKENSSPNLLIESTEKPNKKKLKKRKKINYVTVPESHHERDDEIEKAKSKFLSSKSHSYKGDYNDDESSDDWELDFSDLLIEYEDEIPSVKPCTFEELEKLNQKYDIMEEKIREITEKKIKHKRHSPQKILKDNSKNSINLSSEKPIEELNFKSTDFRLYEEDEMDSDVPSICDLTFRQTKHEITRTNVKPANKEYYESKLAQLYLIELGLTV